MTAPLFSLGISERIYCKAEMHIRAHVFPPASSQTPKIRRLDKALLPPADTLRKTKALPRNLINCNTCAVPKHLAADNTADIWAATQLSNGLPLVDKNARQNMGE